jgi:arylsulfatase A-like enzyme
LLLAPAALALAMSCSGGGQSGATASAASGSNVTATVGARPNIIFVLTDDLSWDLVQYMPHVVALQRSGATFSRYYVSDSLCCPSRTSIFTGKFPHTTGVFTNTGDDGGYATFLAHGNEAHTFALALQAAGYRTAFMGKYLNGYQPATSGVPAGWSHWVGAGNGYPEFNYDLNEDGVLVHYGGAPEEYLVDVLSRKGRRFVTTAAAAGVPFFLEIATFAPHAPYTPAPRYADAFPGLIAPRNPAYGARPDAASPEWLQDIPPLDPAVIAQMDTDYRLRAQAVQAVDDLIGNLQEALIAAGVDGNTYVVFSSDNGYHMGEHSLRPGKMTAFDTDIRVPLVVAGPGVAANKLIPEIAQNIDLCPTFEDLAGAGTPPAVEGLSLVPLLRGQPVTGWRTAALIEHHGPVEAPEDPDLPDEYSGNPTQYESIRVPGAVYVEYATGEKEYYDLASDPFELSNVAASLPPARAQALHDQLAALRNCQGGAACQGAAR